MLTVIAKSTDQAAALVGSAPNELPKSVRRLNSRRRLDVVMVIAILQDLEMILGLVVKISSSLRGWLVAVGEVARRMAGG